MTIAFETLDQLAERLAVSRAVVLRLAMTGELSPVRVGRELRFDPDDVAAFIERKRLVVRRDDDPAGSEVVVQASPGVEPPSHDPD